MAAYDDDMDVSLDLDMAWVQFLPVDDQHTMMEELSTARSLSQRRRLLHEWRVTAEALRDPNARALLLREDEEDDDGDLRDSWRDVT